MSPEDLEAIIRAHRRDSLGVEDGDLSSDRARALDHYHGRPYGNEQEGRSQVVSKDLSETVDWAMPAIMRVFVASGSLGEFDAIGPEDEPAAAQESDYTNQVIMKDNPGVLILHDAIKDTLLLRNGYVKHSWEKKTKISESEYTGLTMDEITKMVTELEAGGAEVEITGSEIRTTMIEGPAGAMPLELIDIKMKVTRTQGKVCIEAVPAEEVRVSKRCRGSLQDSPFTEHVTRKTRSDLIEMGMPQDFVNDLPAYNETVNTQESIARDSTSDESTSQHGSAIVDRSMDEIEYCEAYIKVDWDGDGIAELRKVVTVAEKLPPGDDWNEPLDAVPMTGFIAKRMPHRHIGESLDDEIADLQEIKTVLMRQLLDNIYLTNNNQWLVNERVNLGDFMTSLPGGVKRVEGTEPVNGSVEAINAAPIVGQILPVVDYMDGVKESRTGVSRASSGLDPDTLKQSTKGAFLENLNRATQKIEMMTRMLAETGVKDLVMQVHALLLKHQDKARVVKLRGQFVSVNPQEWRERTDFTVRVGLGTGNEEEKRQRLGMLSAQQDKMAAQGMVGPTQSYAMFEDVAKALGFDVPGKYVMAPNSPEFKQAQQNKPQQQNPLAEAEQVKGQFAMQTATQKSQFDLQVKAMQEEHKRDMEAMRLRFEAMDRNADRASREAIEAAKLEVQAMLKGVGMDIGQPGIGAGLGSNGMGVGQ